MHYADFNAFIASITAINISFRFFFKFEKSIKRTISLWYRLLKKEYKKFETLANVWAIDSSNFYRLDGVNYKREVVRDDFLRTRRRKKAKLFPTKAVASCFLMASITGVILLLFNALIDRGLESFAVSYWTVAMGCFLFVVIVFFFAFVGDLKNLDVSPWIVIAITMYSLVMAVLSEIDSTGGYANYLTVVFASSSLLFSTVSIITKNGTKQGKIFLFFSILICILHIMIPQCDIVFPSRYILYFGLSSIVLPIVLLIISFSIKIAFFWINLRYVSIKIRAVSIGAYEMAFLGKEYSRITKLFLRKVYKESIIKKEDFFLKTTTWLMLILPFGFLFAFFFYLFNYIS